MHDDTGPPDSATSSVSITVQVTPDVARALASTGTTFPDARRLIDVAARRAASLEPVHPGVDDPELATWFNATVRSPDEAERLLDELRDDPAIDAAYIKPAESPP